VTPAAQVRLVRMRARGEVAADLRGTASWQGAAAVVAELAAAPPLILTEGQS
jgi:hypothetical protein